MPKIPTILADQSVRAPMFGESGEGAFNSSQGVGQLGQGLNNLGAGLNQYADNMRAIEKKQARDQTARWVGDSVYEGVNKLNEWQADPNNHNSEEYAKNFKALAEGQMAEYEAKAPSSEAAREFRQRMQGEIATRYGGAVVTTNKTVLEKSRDSIVNQTALSLNTFRNSLDVPNNTAIDDLVHASEDIKARVDSTFGEVSPETARKLKSYVESETALGLASHDAVIAENMVRRSTVLEESDKTTLINKIKGIGKSNDDNYRYQFTMQRNDHMTLVEEGKIQDKLPVEAYTAAYGETGPAYKAEDDLKINIMNRANSTFTKLAPKSSEFQNAELSAMKKGITNFEDAEVFKAVARKLSAVNELQEKDRVSWLSQYNPEVKALNDRLTGVTPGAGRDALLNQRNDAILKFQGFPPDKAENAEHYLRLASNDKSLMSVEEARQNATFVNQGSPKQVIDRLNQILSQFPKAEHQSIAFNDLVTGPGKDAIRPEYQLLWQNKDQWWAENFVTALSDAKSFGALTEERKRELNEKIEENLIWKQFETVMSEDRADEAAAFKSGVAMYANYFHVTQGDKLKQSVSKSIDHLLNSTLGFTSVSGRPLVISRERDEKGKPLRTDEEIKDIGRRLGVALKDVPIQEMDQSRLGAFAAISPDEKNVDRLQAIRNLITEQGFWVTGNSGQSATLFVPGDDGIPFQLRDREGRAFQIAFDDLPEFTRYTGDRFMDFLKPTQGDRVPMQPEKKYPLQQYEFPDHTPGQAFMNRLDALLGVYEKKTYWPTNSYMKRVTPGK